MCSSRLRLLPAVLATFCSKGQDHDAARYAWKKTIGAQQGQMTTLTLRHENKTILQLGPPRPSTYSASNISRRRFPLQYRRTRILMWNRVGRASMVAAPNAILSRCQRALAFGGD